MAKLNEDATVVAEAEETVATTEATTEEATTEKTSEKKKAAKKASAEKMVRIRLPKRREQNANQDEFYSYNFKDYIIKRGETVEVPEGLAELIENGEKAEEAAIEYADKKGLREP